MTNCDNSHIPTPNTKSTKPEAMKTCNSPPTSLTKDCKEENSSEKPQCSGTATPPSISNFQKIGMPYKCSAVTVAQEKEEAVFKIFTNTLQLYKPDEVMFSFNGGKDCTVVLHMLHKYYQHNALNHIRLPVLYIQLDDSFPEIDDFVDDCAERYGLKLLKRKGSIKEVLLEVLKELPEIKAVVMGNRSTDPYCSDLKVMQVTDPDWPRLMRINPILNWSYTDVWTYIFVFHVPYCCLYDHGYTSIGSRTNTHPNPHLKLLDANTQNIRYRPAYELTEDHLERAGRVQINSKV